METSSTYVHLVIKNNILVGTYNKQIHINLKIAKEIVSVRKSFVGARKLPSLIIGSGVVTMDKNAREYLSSQEGTEGISACAIVVNSSFGSFLGNFFVHINKAPMPVKIFSNIPKAESWLQQFVN